MMVEENRDKRTSDRNASLKGDLPVMAKVAKLRPKISELSNEDFVPFQGEGELTEKIFSVKSAFIGFRSLRGRIRSKL